MIRSGIGLQVEFLPLENRKYELRGEWRPDIEYSLEVDSAAFEDIYGLASKPIKQGFKVNSLDTYGTLLVNITSLHDLPLIVQLLDAQDKMVKETKTVNGVAEFYYLKPQKYYMRLIVDRNNNGKWDTGNYDSDQQAEEVYYYPEAIECKAKWDLTESWDPLARELSLQKPEPSPSRSLIRRRKLRIRMYSVPLSSAFSMFLKCKGYEVTQVIYSSHVAAFGQYFCIGPVYFP